MKILVFVRHAVNTLIGMMMKMKTKVFKVVAWYRYDNGDEKDFIEELIIATDIECAKEIFKEKYNRRFFSITVEKYETNKSK